MTRDGGALGAGGHLGPMASLASLPLGEHPLIAATGLDLFRGIYADYLELGMSENRQKRHKGPARQLEGPSE